MMETERRLRLLQFLTQNPEWARILENALAVEAKGIKEAEGKGYQYFGWEWYEVKAPAATLNKMVTVGVLDISYKSSSSTYYRLNNFQEIVEVLAVLSSPAPVAEEEIPQDLFSDIVGYEDIKRLIKQGIEAPRSVHFLLSGPPASAKTMFLMNLARLPGSFYCLGPTLTEAGLSDVLFNYEPRFLLIDEADRLRGIDFGVLNSLMATGIVATTKVGKQRSVKLDTKVFAAGIRVERLPRDFLSRFIKFRFSPYTRDEFIEVTTQVLKGEGIAEGNSTLVGQIVWDIHGVYSDVRLCVSISRLSGNDPGMIRQVIDTLNKYGR